MTDKEHGDFGYEKGSTWHRIMTKGTAAEKQALEKWLDEASADARAMDAWGQWGGTGFGREGDEPTQYDEHEGVREVLTPDVDEYLRRRGYNPEGEDDE